MNYKKVAALRARREDRSRSQCKSAPETWMPLAGSKETKFLRQKSTVSAPSVSACWCQIWLCCDEKGSCQLGCISRGPIPCHALSFVSRQSECHPHSCSGTRAHHNCLQFGPTYSTFDFKRPPGRRNRGDSVERRHAVDSIGRVMTLGERIMAIDP